MDPEWKVLAWRQRPVVAFGFSSRFGAEGEGVGARHDQKCFFIATAIFFGLPSYASYTLSESAGR